MLEQLLQKAIRFKIFTEVIVVKFLNQKHEIRVRNVADLSTIGPRNLAGFHLSYFPAITVELEDVLFITIMLDLAEFQVGGKILMKHCLFRILFDHINI